MMRDSMRDLDAYITGQNIHYNDLVSHYCPSCKAEKSVAMFFDMGGWFYKDDDDPWCDKCQCEMIVKEG